MYKHIYPLLILYIQTCTALDCPFNFALVSCCVALKKEMRLEMGDASCEVRLYGRGCYGLGGLTWLGCGCRPASQHPGIHCVEKIEENVYEIRFHCVFHWPDPAQPSPVRPDPTRPDPSQPGSSRRLRLRLCLWLGPRHRQRHRPRTNLWLHLHQGLQLTA